ncbi:hypothetical protein GALL_412590 [mine drainage metagenome]|uniref:Uncharacterized protein n=1 Tax=mine drainage metagenome TaxID=410659 RepID=A0A1J5Q138_9ZZZZ
MAADGLRNRQGARLATQSNRLLARSAIVRHHDIFDGAGWHTTRYRSDNGVLQYAAGRRALPEIARRRIHDERQLSPAGDGRNRSRQRGARVRRPGVLQRRPRQRRDSAGQQHLQSQSAPQYAKRVHLAQAVVQLLRFDAAGDRADPGLPRQAALHGPDEVRCRSLLQRGEHQPGLDAARHTQPGGRHSPGHHDQHRRSVEREEHPMEVLWRQLQRFRDWRCARRNLLQHLQPVRVSVELSGDACRSYA